MCARVSGVAALQREVWQKMLMGIAQWADVPAFVPVGAIRPRFGRASSGMWGRSGLARRETRVKPVSPALVARETFVKPCRCQPRRRPRPQQRNPSPQRRDLATSSNNPTPQPRGVARKPCPGLVRGYEPS